MEIKKELGPSRRFPMNHPESTNVVVQRIGTYNDILSLSEWRSSLADIILLYMLQGGTSRLLVGRWVNLEVGLGTS